MQQGTEPMTLDQLIDCLQHRPQSINRRQLYEAAQHLKRLKQEVASAECVVRQVSRDAFGVDMTVQEYAEKMGYDS